VQAESKVGKLGVNVESQVNETIKVTREKEDSERKRGREKEDSERKREIHPQER